MADYLSAKEIILEVRESQKYKLFKKIYAKALTKIDVERDRKEVLGLYSSRTSRRLYGDKQYSVKRIMEASANDMMVRSRIVEIRVQIKMHASYVEEAINALSKQVAIEYKDDLKQFRTADLRKGVGDRLFKEPLAMLAEVDSFVAMIEHFVKDIDQSGFALRNLLEGLKLLDGSKGSRVV